MNETDQMDDFSHLAFQHMNIRNNVCVRSVFNDNVALTGGFHSHLRGGCPVQRLLSGSAKER